ncbi:hypothetical protein EON62_05305 [archaeon]|nr:MAG: hypothetical protein EON62_05305 [archaeon]
MQVRVVRSLSCCCSIHTRVFAVRSPPHGTLQTDLRTGLTDATVRERFAIYGYNELDEKKVNPLLVFLSYFWGPMPVMIWAAALVELIKASITGEGWEDFGVLLILQFANATVGYIEERNAGDAIAALKQQLAPMCHVCRNGVYVPFPADAVPALPLLARPPACMHAASRIPHPACRPAVGRPSLVVTWCLAT